MTSIIYFSKRIFLFLLLTHSAYGFNFLSPNFYSTTCPNLQRIVRSTMKEAIAKDPTKGAVMLRLFFHGCFVNACDASVLLDDTPIMVGEKNAPANKNSLCGFEVIDKIKARVEASCPRMVTCADILALAARDSVSLKLIYEAPCYGNWDGPSGGAGAASFATTSTMGATLLLRLLPSAKPPALSSAGMMPGHRYRFDNEYFKNLVTGHGLQLEATL